MTATAPLRRLGSDDALHVLDRLPVPLVIERSSTVCRAVPFVIDIGVAATALFASHEELCRDDVAACCLRRRWENGPSAPPKASPSIVTGGSDVFGVVGGLLAELNHAASGSAPASARQAIAALLRSAATTARTATPAMTMWPMRRRRVDVVLPVTARITPVSAVSASVHAMTGEGLNFRYARNATTVSTSAPPTCANTLAA